MSPSEPRRSSRRGLKPSEEAWRVPFDRLLQRFPEAGPDAVAKALRDTGGHAGRAAAALRSLAAERFENGEDLAAATAAARPPRRGWLGESAATTAAARRPSPAETFVSPVGAKQEDMRVLPPGERHKRDQPSPVTSGEPLISGGQERRRTKANDASQKITPADKESRGLSTSELVQVLSNEGRQLRHELDCALAEARAERLRADLAEKAAAAPLHDSVMDAARMQFLFQAEAAAAQSCSRLGVELEESRDESQRLRRELEAALTAGTDGSKPSTARADRERLRRELESTLSQRAASAIGMREAELRHEVERTQQMSAQLKEELASARFTGFQHVRRAVPAAPAAPAEPAIASAPPRAAAARQGIGRDVPSSSSSDRFNEPLTSTPCEFSQQRLQSSFVRSPDCPPQSYPSCADDACARRADSFGHKSYPTTFAAITEDWRSSNVVDAYSDAHDSRALRLNKKLDELNSKLRAQLSAEAGGRRSSSKENVDVDAALANVQEFMDKAGFRSSTSLREPSGIDIDQVPPELMVTSW